MACRSGGGNFRPGWESGEFTGLLRRGWPARRERKRWYSEAIKPSARPTWTEFGIQAPKTPVLGDSRRKGRKSGVPRKSPDNIRMRFMGSADGRHLSSGATGVLPGILQEKKRPGVRDPSRRVRSTQPKLHIRRSAGPTSAWGCLLKKPDVHNTGVVKIPSLFRLIRNSAGAPAHGDFRRRSLLRHRFEHEDRLEQIRKNLFRIRLNQKYLGIGGHGMSPLDHPATPPFPAAASDPEAGCGRKRRPLEKQAGGQNRIVRRNPPDSAAGFGEVKNALRFAMAPAPAGGIAVVSLDCSMLFEIAATRR